MAGELLSRANIRTEKADGITSHILQHLKAHYSDFEPEATKGILAGSGIPGIRPLVWWVDDATEAAVTALATLLKGPLPRSSRRLILKAAAQYQGKAALHWLIEEAKAGRQPTKAEGALPEPLAAALAAFQAARTEAPNDPLWAEQAKLAVQIQQRASPVWALALAWPVLEAGSDPSAVAQGVSVVQDVIESYASLESPERRDFALRTSRRLLEATAKNQGVWSAAALRHANLLDKTALNLLNENVRTGNENRNSKISDLQKELLDTLQGLVGRDTASTAAAVALLEKHVQPWTARGHWAVAEELYAALARTLPEDARWTMEIKEIELGVAQVKQEHQSLATGGLSIPRKLDPRLQKALLRCYALQAGLEANSPRLKQVRGVWEGIVAYYRGLEYDDVAEAAIKTKPEQAVAAADQFAAFTLLVLQEDRARRKVVRLGHRYGAAENLTLTPAVRAVLDGWQKFLTENPGSPLVPDVVGRVLGIASFFEQQKAAQIAADVYGELSKTASGIKALAQAAPGSASTADRAAFLRAVALDTQARKVLALALAERRGPTPPPTQLSKEFATALTAYTEFAVAHPDTPLAAEAMGKVLAIATEYAQLDAWEVTDAVFAELLRSKLPIRRPERLEFARGLAQVGRVIPDHARQVMLVLTTGGLRGPEGMRETPAKPTPDVPGGSPASSSIPPLPPPPTSPALGGMMGGMGMGGYGGMGATWGNMPSTPGSTASGRRDAQVLAAIRQQETNRATQVAQLREPNQPMQNANAPAQPMQTDTNQGEFFNQTGQFFNQTGQGPLGTIPVLSEAELTRQDKALTAAYDIFQGIRKAHPTSPTAEQARGEILVMIGHWRGLAQWQAPPPRPNVS